MPDGRVLYDRWEYVDRNFGDAQGLWSVNPDGTNHAVFWGNNTNSPGAVLDARVLPGGRSIHRDLLVLPRSPLGRSGHGRPPPGHRRPVAGAPHLARRTPSTWLSKGNYDTFKQVKPKYEDPYPLSDHFFLCSRMTGHGEADGYLSARHVRQRDRAARRESRLL